MRGIRRRSAHPGAPQEAGKGRAGQAHAIRGQAPGKDICKQSGRAGDRAAAPGEIALPDAPITRGEANALMADGRMLRSGMWKTPASWCGMAIPPARSAQP